MMSTEPLPRDVPARVQRHQVTESRFGDVRVRITRAGEGKVVLPAAAGAVSVHGVRRGRLVLDAPGGDPELGAGGGVIVPPGMRPGAIVLRAVDVVSITVPGLELDGGADRGPRVVAPGASLLGGAMAFAAEVAVPVEPPPSSAAIRHIEQLIRDMVERLLLAAGAQDERSPVQHALAVIMRAYGDPALSSRRVADEVKLSVRQLERQFRIRGTSIATEVRRARIRAAARLLAEEGTSALSIDQIARRVGFSGGSPLARAMVREGMPSPSALRQQARDAR